MRSATTATLLAALTVAFHVGCSDPELQTERADAAEREALKPRADGSSLLESELTVHEVQEIVRSGVTPKELRARIGSIPVIHSRAARYQLKDGLAILSLRLVEAEMIDLAAIVAVKHNKAEQVAGDQAPAAVE